MRTFKIDVHSMVDIITNSSTVIYTYQDGTVEPVKELVNEVLRMIDPKLTWEDVMCIGSFCTTDVYSSYIRAHDSDGLDDDTDAFMEGISGLTHTESSRLIDDYVDTLKSRILRAEMPKPYWFKDAEGIDESIDYNRHPNSVEIVAKDPVYEQVLRKVINVICGVSAASRYDG